MKRTVDQSMCLHGVTGAEQPNATAKLFICNLIISNLEKQKKRRE